MPNPLSDVERFAIHTSDGLGLRAELLGAGPPGAGPPPALAVVCHPHPLHGGTMHNHVVSSLFSTLAAAGVPTIRFNFRGTSGSEGRHGGGIAERLDVLAAVEAVTARFQTTGDDGRPGEGESGPVPVLLTGYSFGALVALSTDHPRLGGWLAVAPPLTMGDTDRPVAATDPRPTLIVTGTNDDFSPASAVEQLTDEWVTTTVIGLDGEDHFLATATERLATEARRFVGTLAGHRR